MFILGNRLIEIRNSLGLSVDEFAKALGVHRSSIYRYEGQNKEEQREIPLNKAFLLCERFDISMDWLMGLSEIKYRNQSPNKLTEIFSSLSSEGQKELFSYAMYLKNKEESKGVTNG